MKYVLAFDCGTGGCRATLFSEAGDVICSVSEKVPTRYPSSFQHVQSPEMWTEALFSTGKTVVELARSDKGVAVSDISAIGIGGQSLGAIPLDSGGRLLRPWAPIWSDGRSTEQTAGFFTKFDEDTWYRRTGAGMPPQNYPLFKLLWYWDNEPGMFLEIDQLVSLKDYLNLKLTGVLKTDYSSAGGSGCWNLVEKCYDEEIIAKAGVSKDIFPKAVPSTEVIGTLTDAAAERLGLSSETKVVAGGVDNCCIALGAKCYKSGRLAASVGSCSWIGTSSSAPLLDAKIRPFVFPHVVEGQFLTSTGVFSTGTTLRWVKEHLCRDIDRQAKESGRNPYYMMADEAKKSVIGANCLILNPSFGGPSRRSEGVNLRGAFLGLSLFHTQADIIRATFEGMAMGLKGALDEIRTLASPKTPIRMAGFAMPELILYIYSNILNHDIITGENSTAIPALGAASLAAVGAGIWKDFEILEEIADPTETLTTPDAPSVASYRPVLYVFKKSTERLNQLAEDWEADLFEID